MDGGLETWIVGRIVRLLVEGEGPLLCDVLQNDFPQASCVRFNLKYSPLARRKFFGHVCQ